MHRRLILRAAAFAVAVVGIGGAARADVPLFTLDLRVHGTGAKDAVVTDPGDVVVMDLFIRANGQDANPNNDGMNNLFSNFKSSSGGLIGDLVGLPPPAPFNLTSSSPGRQRDLDGDGDLDIGSLGPDGTDFYFSRGGGVTTFNQPAGGFFIGSVRFTAAAMNAPSTDVNWFARQSNDAALGIFGQVDGVGYALAGLDPRFAVGAPVTIRAATVTGGGTTEFLSGTINSHLIVDHTIRQGPGNGLVLAGGVTAKPGGFLDLRVEEFYGGSIQVSDPTSGNEGGAIFVREMWIDGQSEAKFTQTKGLTQVGGPVGIFNGVLAVSGGTFRANSLGLSGTVSGRVEQTGGFLTVDYFGIGGTAGSSNRAEITGGILTVTTSGSVGDTSIGGGGPALLHVNGGQVNFNGQFYLNRTSADHQVLVSAGTANLQDTYIGQGAAIQQDGGLVAASAVILGTTGGGAGGESARYVLSAGTFNPGLLNIGFSDTPATMTQSGGQLISGGSVYVSDRYDLSGGEAHIWHARIEAPEGAAAGLLNQTGGLMSADHLIVAGTYRISGGTLQVNRELRIDPGGTIDFAGSGAAIGAGTNALVALPVDALGNVSNASLVGRVGSLINYPAGYDPAAHFGHVESDGLLHEQGTPLHIPAGKSVTGSGNIIGNTTNDGELHPGYVGGRLDITGSYAQSPDAKLVFEFAGSDFDSRDYLAISGAATLDGVLDIDLIANFLPESTDAFTILSASAITGRFSNADSQVFFEGGRFDVSYTSNSVILRNFAAVPEPATAAFMLSGLLALGVRRRHR